MEILVRIDRRGRIVIPKAVREGIGLGRVARLRVEGGKITIEPAISPLKALRRTVRVNITDVEGELRELRREAEEQLRREASRRWRSLKQTS